MEIIEKTILANLLASKENCKLFKDRGFVDSYFFFPEFRKFFQVLWFHYETKNDIMQLDTFESLIRRSPNISDDYAAKLLVLYAEIQTIPPASNFSVLLDEFLIYFKTSSLRNSMSTASEHLHGKDPNKALDYLRNEVQRIQLQTESKNLESGFLGHGIDVLDLYQKRLNHPELFCGAELGFPSMDAVVTHKPGTVCLIMGQMKSAKSVLMVNIANNLLSRGKKVYYHVNEGGKELVENRIHSCHSGLYMTKIERQKLSAEEYLQYENCVNTLKATNLLYVDSVPNSLSNAGHIEKMLTSLQDRMGKYEVALIDYLGLMNTTSSVTDDWKRMGAITLELKDVAMKLNIPIIVVGHVNRKGMQENKKHFDLDELGVSLEPLKHVDVIMSWRIHEPELFELTNTGQGTLSIRGSRQSGQKSVVLDVDTNKMKIWENFRPITITASTTSTGATF